jgi:hypothetical protein
MWWINPGSRMPESIKGLWYLPSRPSLVPGAFEIGILPLRIIGRITNTKMISLPPL